MVNILIANDNIFFAKQIMDNIDSKNVKVCNLTINGQETYSILNEKDNIDIVLLKSKFSDLSGVKVINMLSKFKKNKYKKSFILLLNKVKINKRLSNNEMIYKILNDENDIIQIVRTINILIDIKQTMYRRENVVNEIKKLQYNISHIGTNYLIDAILLILEKNNVETFCLKKDIFPKLAEKYSTKESIIKENMYKATDFMNVNCDINIKKVYFCFQDDTKPTLKMVIYSIVNHIYRNF